MIKKRNTATHNTTRLSAARRDILLSGLVCSALVLCAFYWLQYIELPRKLQQHASNITENIAEHQRTAVIDVLDAISLRIDAQAKYPPLASALQRGDDRELRARERTLRRSFPAAVDAKLVRLGPQGIADEGSETKRLRNHIEIDMLRKASDSGELIIEAYQYDRGWLISMMQAAGPYGAIVVSFDSEFFANILRNIAGDSVNNELLQSYKGRKDVVIAAASKQYDAYAASRPLPVPGWTLRVIPQPATVRALSWDSTLIHLIGLLCLALIGASHLIFFLRAKPTASTTDNTDNEAAPQDSSEEAGLEQQLARKLAARRPDNTAGNTFDPSASLTPPLPEPAPLSTAPAAQGAAAPQATADTDAADHREATEDAAASGRLNCFRSYDIRGIAEHDLDDEHCRQIGLALGSEAIARGQSKMLLGRDGRSSSPRIREALLAGLQASGIHVVDLGLISTPMLNFACYDLNIGNAVIITGSHNPPEYNGLKMILDFQSLSSDDIQALAERIDQQDFHQGDGQLSSDSIEQRYIDRICGDVVIAQSLKVVVDAGNGATANVAVPIFEELGCEVVALFCEVDGDFPNRSPDPTIPENLDALATAVAEHGADIGIAFDGDGDRVAVVSAAGRRPLADELLMVLADDMVSRNPGCEILFDVKCSRRLNQLIVERGGRPTMWKCGHSHMKRKMASSEALLGGEFSGHIFFKERWYGFDDGIYAAARLLEALTLSATTLDEELSHYPQLFSSPEILLPIDDEQKFAVVESFAALANFNDAQLVNIDGLRYEFRNGWGLLRASNTGPALTLRFEGESEAALAGIRESFAQTLAKIDPALADSL